MSAESEYVPAPAPAGAAPTRPDPPLRRLLVPLGVLGAVAAGFAYVGAVDPGEPGHYPACPLFRLTGLLCPGCGGLRSAHAFVHGDLGTALGANAPAVLAYLAFAVLWTTWAVRSARGRSFSVVPPTAVLWATGALLAVFTVVRNLPVGGWLRP
ncbi:DUF2752 domain-containing protein [Streptomyces sp. NPDC059578]|uniref:DUF2752 domain-containing protein n=1 Tax=Streptomyces sp. NPDC059578 TaxID=3346874 RepID=UPI00369BB204